MTNSSVLPLILDTKLRVGDFPRRFVICHWRMVICHFLSPFNLIRRKLTNHQSQITNDKFLCVTVDFRSETSFPKNICDLSFANGYLSFPESLQLDLKKIDKSPVTNNQ